ncbi:hypothetical protein M0R88_06800 [Halorussus gelatinilyticus]|uniref:Uncharacterized protein n=1 Tax=Halorussus gelatinilyticus TaxID=2937524 RepID=A0A8U0IP70_9EURY|nr:hypothetical protein [Halorussus gelatinilyticus]UPW02391.1 hypothetical protein M0R88_06800 [Halorussus gelatinilyticus]
MRVRDAVEEDGEVLGELADAPAEVMRNVVHDRTVRVAERPSENGDSSNGSDASGDSNGEDSGGEGSGGGSASANAGGADSDDSNSDGTAVVGFVGFDAMPGTVRVTYLRGTPEARERLLEEPVRFARKEGMAVEALVPEGETETKEVVEAAGFQRAGTGPRFEGGQTLEYRLEPSGRADSARR